MPGEQVSYMHSNSKIEISCMYEVIHEACGINEMTTVQIYCINWYIINVIKLKFIKISSDFEGSFIKWTIPYKPKFSFPGRNFTSFSNGSDLVQQLLLKSIPSCFELKCRAYSLLSQCYHLVGAIPSQKQILNKGLELSAISGDGYVYLKYMKLYISCFQCCLELWLSKL